MTTDLYSSPTMRAATGETVRPGGLDLTRRALEFCAFPPGRRILDIGCGSGATVRLLIQEYGLDASGIDPSPAMISQGVATDPPTPVSLGDGMNLPREDGELDGAIMECALSITPDPETVLREVRRILKPGGKLILSDMYLLDEAKSLEYCESAATLLCLRNASSRATLEEKLTAAGFRMLLWEDHLPHLKRLGAEIILKFGSLSQFLAEASGEQAARPTSFRGVSYCLVVAEKV